MKTVDYLREIYGYSVPIFLKDIRIGRKSKVSIRKDLSRAVENGEIKRDHQGVYYFDPKNGLPTEISVDDVVRYRFVENHLMLPGVVLDVYGYYTGYTFLNYLGISQQVPAVKEITTNKTSCKRIFKYDGYRVLLRKSKVPIDRSNYKILQFLDSLYLLDVNDIKENYKTLFEYVSRNLTKADFQKYIHLYPTKVIKLVVEGSLIGAFR